MGRIWNVWTLALVLLGLVILLSLVVIWADLRRARTRRPRWKRRIVAVAMAILAAVGAYPVAKGHPYKKPKPVVMHSCYSMAVPLPPPPPPPSDSPATEPSDAQSRIDLLRQFGERGVLAPPVADRARQQYIGEA